MAHSKSPEMYNAVYEALGFPWHYDRMDCTSETEARAVFENGDWLQVNITMPYKPLAYDLATVRTDYARMARGANVLIRMLDGLYADNTDGRGCISYLEQCGCSFEDASVVICGTGPTAQSILYAAARSQAGSLTLLSRTSEKAQAQLRRFNESFASVDPLSARQAGAFFASSYDQAREVIEQADIIIDATSLGMKVGDPAPFDTQLLHAGQTVFDVVYGHGTTTLVDTARKAGCEVYDGEGMLVAQAVQTVYDIQDILHIPLSLDASELFAIMAKAAGFTDHS